MENNQELKTITFSRNTIHKKILQIDSHDMVEIAFWSKKDKKLFYAADTVRNDFDQFGITGVKGKQYKVEITEYHKKGIFNSILINIFRSKMKHTKETINYDITFIPEDFYSFVVASSYCTFGKKVVEDDAIEYILRNDAPIELLEFLNKELRDGQLITIRHLNDLNIAKN